MDTRCVGLLLFGVLIRLIGFLNKESILFFMEMEVTTPIHSFLSTSEGLKLLQLKMSPYQSDVFHDTPLVLSITHLSSKISPIFLTLVFILIDVFSGVALSGAKVFASTPDAPAKSLPILACYLLNPFLILNCSVLNLSLIITFFFYSMFTLALSQRRKRMATIFCACLISLSYRYYVTILPIAALHFLERRNKKTLGLVIADLLVFLSSVLSVTAAIFCLQHQLLLTITPKNATPTPFLTHFNRTHLFEALRPHQELTPNIGLYWYTFAEMFPHFHKFFLHIFNVMPMVLALPCSIRFHTDPPFVACLCFALNSILSPFPCYGLVGYAFSLIFIGRNLVFKYAKNLLITATILAFCILLFPIMWHLWITIGSANSNFYYGVSLAFNLAQIMFLSDAIFSYLRCEFSAKYGKDAKCILTFPLKNNSI